MSGTAQKTLIYTRKTWMHYIGGYYKNIDKFVNEAIRSRISRRAPAQTVRGMQFGDRIVFLRYMRRAEVVAFAEGQIIGITLDGEIAQVIGEKLTAEGMAEYKDTGGAGQTISRECGSYTLIGSWVVTCPLSDVVEMAIELADQRGEKLFVMVNAELTKIYDKPIYLQPAPSFSRGFIKVNDQAEYSFDEPEMPAEKTIFAITNYAKG